jgi:hypothetical protein
MMFMGYTAAVNLAHHVVGDSGDVGGVELVEEQLAILGSFVIPCSAAVGVDSEVTTAYVFFKTCECLSGCGATGTTPRTL